jgi:PHS family inorganic phosphate transporter-like MFS transporter
MVGMVFAMQGAGLVVGSGLLAWGISDDTAWRILLALGAAPGLAVFYLRRQIHETPRFAIAGGAAAEAEAAVAQATGAPAVAAPAGESKARHPQGMLEGFAVLARSRRMLLWLFGTAGAWALLDFSYYGNTISFPEITGLLNPAVSLLHNTLIQLVIIVAFAVPGYIVAIALMDRLGRKYIQILGFAMMALAFALIGLVPAVSADAAPFIASTASATSSPSSAPT